MVQVSYPGVYTQEVPSGVNSISGVSTSVTAFVGMCKNGPLLVPTRVLGFRDYERVFSADTSLGELSEQVRQFFFNGGEEAIIVRVADGALESTLSLDSFATAGIMTLTARDAGLNGNQLRARVDYNTESPERTFNLSVFRETFDASGLPVLGRVELFSDLSMSTSSPRYAETIINQSSELVRAAVNAAAVTASATLAGYSATSRIFDDEPAAVAALVAAIGAAGPPGGTFGRFRIKVGATPWLSIQVDSTGLTLAQVQQAINDALAPHTAATVTLSVAANEPLRITASGPRQDVVVDVAGQLDIAVALGFGAAQGGLEVSSFSSSRPKPSGLVSRIETTAGSLDSLLAFAAVTKAGLATPGVTLVRPFTVPSSPGIAYPSAAGTMQEGTRAVGLKSLLNVRENLEALASALRESSKDWKVEVHGYRLVLSPNFGDSSAGSGAGFASASPNLGAGGHLFDGVSGDRSAQALASGDDGSIPQDGDYAEAFQRIDESVDLFNLLVLPKSAEDTALPSVRSRQWGPASVFCLERRAFLLADLEPTTDTPEAALAANQSLRNGIVKDHTAVYWPRVTISSDGLRKNVDPSGSVAGATARIDASRGVWKAAAGLETDLRAVLGVETPLSDKQNGLLNPQAINVIRSFASGIVSWGARTMDGFDNSGNSDYRYVPPRRLALFIEESLARGLRFAVFEPNDEPLWAQIRLAAGAFMNGLFRRGAFAGKTATDAYFVQCDAETTTQTDRNLGIVNVRVGFAPLKPAEFVVITIQQKAGQVQI